MLSPGLGTSISNSLHDKPLNTTCCPAQTSPGILRKICPLTLLSHLIMVTHSEVLQNSRSNERLLANEAIPLELLVRRAVDVRTIHRILVLANPWCCHELWTAEESLTSIGPMSQVKNFRWDPLLSCRRYSLAQIMIMTKLLQIRWHS